MRVSTTLRSVGPFFESDPAKTLRENAEVMLAAMAAEGEKNVRARVAWGGSDRTGTFYSHVIGRTRRLDGLPFSQPTFVVSQQHVYPWRNAGVRQYRGGKLEAKRHMFRQARAQVRRFNQANAAELLRGIT